MKFTLKLVNNHQISKVKTQIRVQVTGLETLSGSWRKLVSRDDGRVK